MTKFSGDGGLNSGRLFDLGGSVLSILWIFLSTCSAEPLWPGGEGAGLSGVTRSDDNLWNFIGR